ncbi:hypothetical protein [Mumia sp. Pv 4-285]|uniref:hypothetical protein n=1 Tax=Mumia qirimensis TaxID=3234852 RepID=UPI00351D3849
MAREVVPEVDRRRLPIGKPRVVADTPLDARDAVKPEPAAPSHWGGTRTGMIARLPSQIPGGEVRSQFTHVIDVVPTILEYAGIPEPDQVNGIPQRPLEGISFKYAIDDAAAEERHDTQYFEIGGNRGIYHRGWTAVTQHWLPWPDPDDHIPALRDDTWELYGPDDWTQAHDLASEQPDKLRELQERFLIEGASTTCSPSTIDSANASTRWSPEDPT